MMTDFSGRIYGFSGATGFDAPARICLSTDSPHIEIGGVVIPLSQLQSRLLVQIALGHSEENPEAMIAPTCDRSRSTAPAE